MTEEDDDRDERQPLSRRLAGMLSELEDAEVALTAEQADLSRRLATVNAELDRLAKVKRTILGEPAKKASTRRPAGTAPTSSPKTTENRRKVVEWIDGRQNGGGPFTGGDVARGIGVDSRGLGPILKGLEVRGILEVIGRNEDDRKMYRRTDKALSEADA